MVVEDGDSKSEFDESQYSESGINDIFGRGLLNVPELEKAAVEEGYLSPAFAPSSGAE